jgi:hypothetical protein
VPSREAKIGWSFCECGLPDPGSPYDNADDEGGESENPVRRCEVVASTAGCGKGDLEGDDGEDYKARPPDSKPGFF